MIKKNEWIVKRKTRRLSPVSAALGGIVGDGAGYGAPFQGDAVEEGVPDLRFRVEGCQVHP